MVPEEWRGGRHTSCPLNKYRVRHFLLFLLCSLSLITFNASFLPFSSPVPPSPLYPLSLPLTLPTTTPSNPSLNPSPPLHQPTHTQPHSTKMAAFSTTLKTSWLLCLGLVILALLAPQQADAHMAMLYPTPRGGYGTKQFDGRIHVFVDYKGFKFPCGGYPKGPTTSTLLASFAFLFLYSGTKQEWICSPLPFDHPSDQLYPIFPRHLIF